MVEVSQAPKWLLLSENPVASLIKASLAEQIYVKSVQLPEDADFIAFDVP